jgi:hypothetical protein
MECVSTQSAVYPGDQVRQGIALSIPASQGVSPHPSLSEGAEQAQRVGRTLIGGSKRLAWNAPLRLRLLWRVNCEALRIAAGQNLKCLLKKRGWGRHPMPTEAIHASILGSFTWYT